MKRGSGDVMGDSNQEHRTGITRRAALRALGSAAAAALAAPALAQQLDPISQALQARSAEWSDGFDSNNGRPNVRTAAPVLAPETLAACQLAIQRYSDIVSRGGWQEVPSDQPLRLGTRHPNVMALRERLIIGGDLSGAAGMSDSFDSYVDTAVRRFQARHGIPADGSVGTGTFGAMNVPAQARLSQLTKNIERLRPLATRPPIDRFVMVNIPAAQIEAVQGGRVVSRHTAIVGKIDRPSPLVSSRIHEINFNPFWTVPASIIRKDLIPLVRKTPNYLVDQHIHIYDRKGNEISPQQIDWNTDQAVNYLFRQDPGEWNSMGSVKINFASPEGVYMHDTPNKGLFNDDFRFDSSGCVRVQNIRQLITWLLQETPGWNRDQVDQMFRVSNRLDVRLTKPVQLNWVYLTAWSTQDGVVQFRDDIYLQDGIGNVALANPPPPPVVDTQPTGTVSTVSTSAAAGPVYSGNTGNGGYNGYNGAPIPLIGVGGQ